MVVVEDDSDTRELIGAVLERAGMAVGTAGSLADGLELARGCAPDVLVVDLGLPDAQGTEALEAIRADPALGEVPIVVVSAENDGRRLAEAMAAGAASYLAKPFSIDGVAEAVRSVAGV